VLQRIELPGLSRLSYSRGHYFETRDRAALRGSFWESPRRYAAIWLCFNDLRFCFTSEVTI
jgi:hypothetical protein